eukprot:6713471-Pyramimonas_sp.AAC.2
MLTENVRRRSLGSTGTPGAWRPRRANPRSSKARSGIRTQKTPAHSGPRGRRTQGVGFLGARVIRGNSGLDSRKRNPS